MPQSSAGTLQALPNPCCHRCRNLQRQRSQRCLNSCYSRGRYRLWQSLKHYSTAHHSKCQCSGRTPSVARTTTIAGTTINDGCNPSNAQTPATAGAATYGGCAPSATQIPAYNPCYHRCRNLRRQRFQRCLNSATAGAQSAAATLQALLKCPPPQLPGSGYTPSVAQILLSRASQSAAAALPAAQTPYRRCRNLRRLRPQLYSIPTYRRCRNLRRLRKFLLADTTTCGGCARSTAQSPLPQVPQSAAATLPTPLKFPATAGAAIDGNNAASTTQMPTTAGASGAAAALPTLLKFHTSRALQSAAATLPAMPKSLLPQVPQPTAAALLALLKSLHRRCRNLRRQRYQRQISAIAEAASYGGKAPSAAQIPASKEPTTTALPALLKLLPSQAPPTAAAPPAPLTKTPATADTKIGGGSAPQRCPNPCYRRGAQTLHR